VSARAGLAFGVALSIGAYGVAAFVRTPVSAMSEQQSAPSATDVLRSPDRLTRCTYHNRQTVDGRADREAVCVYEDDIGRVFLASVRVLCDEGCRPVGTPALTEFYE